MTSKATRLQRRKNKTKPRIFTFRNIGLAFIGALCIGWLSVWILRIVQNIGQPQIEYSESFMLYISHLFGTGQWSWNIVQASGGYMVSFYPPVFYWTLGHLMNVFGYSLVVGRIFALSSFVACLILIYLIVHNLTGEKIYAGIAALLPLTQPFVNTWSLFVRVDFLSLMFELAGVYFVLKFWRSPWKFLSLLFFALAFYTKQSTVAGAAAVCIFMLIKNWRFALSYTAMLLIVIGVPLFIGSLLTGGQFFNEVILYQRLSPAIRPLDEIKGFMGVAYVELLPIFIIGMISAIKNIKTLPGIFALAAFAVNIVMITRPGGAQNYFFEVILALSIVCGATLPWIIGHRQGDFIAFFAVVLITLALNNRLNIYPGPEYTQNVKQAEAIIQDANYPILTENADVVVSSGKIPYDEPFIFGNLPRLGYWNENLLLDDMRSGRVEYVITQYKMPNQATNWRLDTTVQQSIVDNYHIVMDTEDKHGYGFVVYRNNKE
jgi:hypothetical protein